MLFRPSVLPILLLSLACPMPGFALGDIFYKQKVHGFAGPMAILQLANEWKGDFKNGDDGFLFHHSEVGFSIGDVSISYVKRLHAEYHMPNGAARIFYLHTRKQALAQPLNVTAALRAYDYRGEGFKLAYRFHNDSAYIRPHISWLRLNTITWGHWSGDFSYRSHKDWDLDIDVDYHYTEDKLLRRGKAPGRPLVKNNGELYSLGLEAGFHWRGYTLDYQGDNLHARINWPDLATTDARVSTQGAFFLLGYEFDEDKEFTPSAIHQLDQSLRLTKHWQLVTQSYLNRIRNSHSLGIAYDFPRLKLRLLHELELDAWQLGIEHPNVELSLMSETLNVSRSRLLSAQLALNYSF